MTLAGSIQDRLNAGEIIIMDGATGTEFSRRGIAVDPNLTWSAQPNLTAPDLACSILENQAADYMAAGDKSTWPLAKPFH